MTEARPGLAMLLTINDFHACSRGWQHSNCHQHGGQDGGGNSDCHIRVELARLLFHEGNGNENENGSPAWMTKSLDDSRTEQAARLASEGLSQKEIAEVLGINKSNVSRALKRAREKGLIEEKVSS